MIKKHIPNAITSLNLFSGCIAVVSAIEGDLTAAFLFIILSAVFDFFDGFAARKLGVTSPIGKDLDSLADDISFGLAPAAIVSSLLKECDYPEAMLDWAFVIPYIPYVIAVFSALRLAKFNNDERQHVSFIGMPTPANAIMTGAMANMPVAAFLWQPAPVFSDMLHFGLWSVLMLLAYAFITSWLLVCPVPMFSFKQKGKTQYVFAGCAIVLTALFAFAGLFATMVLYIAISFASTNRNTK